MSLFGEPPLIQIDLQLLYVVLGVLGLFTATAAAVEIVIKHRLFLTGQLLALSLGLILREGIGFKPDLMNRETITYPLLIARLTLAIQVVASALDLPRHYLRKKWVPLFLLLVPGLVLTWGLATLVIWGITQVPPVEALLFSACITPTDPVLSFSILKGEFAEDVVPGRLRDLLSAESGANDGLAYPFVMLAMLILAYHFSAGKLIARYVVGTWIYEVLGSIILGSLIGYVAGKVFVISKRRGWMEEGSSLTYSVSLTIGVLGFVTLLSMDEILACFASGVAFSTCLNDRDLEEQQKVQESVDLVAGYLFFIMLGILMPWEVWGETVAPWRLVVAALVVLIVKRLPVTVLLYPVTTGVNRLSEALFIGWFGPVGVAAFYYTLLILREEGISADSKQRAVEVITMIILGSVITHGVTGVPFTHALKKRIR